MSDEMLTDTIADALSGYFDFGEGGKDAEEEAAYALAEYIVARLPKNLIMVDRDEWDDGLTESLPVNDAPIGRRG